MVIKTAYSPGDVVHRISQDHPKTWVPCKACAATGRVPLQDGTDSSCPRCYGHKGGNQYNPLAWALQGTLTIGQVRVEITDSPGQPGEEMFDNFKAQSETKEQYMCVESGIGSGTIWPVEDLFPTAEEAVAECKLRNVKEKKVVDKDSTG